MGRKLICDRCVCTDVVVLNPIYVLDEECEPTEEIEGYQVECDSCFAFWDDLIL